MINNNDKILVVEDDEGLNYLIRKKLEHEGFISEGVRRGKDAIKWANDNPYSLLLLDYQLPDLNAYDIIKQINKNENPVSFLIITGQGDEKIAVEMMKLGARDYLVKDSNLLDIMPAVVIKAFTDFKKDLKLKETEEELRKSKQMLELVMDNIPQYIYWKDINSKYIGCNSNFARLIGLTDITKIIGKSDFDLPWQKESAEKSLKIDKDVIEKNKSFYHIIEPFLNDNYLTWLETNKVPLHDIKGEVVGILGTSEDITERKKIEDDLIAEKERQAIILKSISDGMIVTDNNGIIILINQVAEVLTGWTQSEAIGKELPDVFCLIDINNHTSYKNIIKKYIMNNEINKMNKNTLIISREGNEKIISNRAASIRDRNNNIIGTILVFRDITEEQKMEEEIQKKYKLESLGVLAGGIAHDFNNIITAILGNISLALLRLNPEDEICEILHDSEKAVKQAIDLAQQLLTFAKGGAPIKKTATIGDLIQESAKFVLRGSNIKCNFNIENDLLSVEIDTGQMSQVINNLVINAEQAMPTGGEITISAKNFNLSNDYSIPLPEGEYIKISIADNGMGIDEENLKKIFDPYFTTKMKGNGLGLTTCYSIIKKHEGHITVESKKGIGTVFNIYLPVSNHELSQENINNELVIGKQQKILVMDDEEIVRKVVGRMLTYLGYKVELTHDGLEAIELYKKSMQNNNLFDVIIMDLTVPGKMGGEKAIQEILKINSKAKVILSSGYSNDLIISNYKEYGFSGYIIKPYKVEELSRILSIIFTT